jgi:hypothetical protein
VSIIHEIGESAEVIVPKVWSGATAAVTQSRLLAFCPLIAFHSKKPSTGKIIGRSFAVTSFHQNSRSRQDIKPRGQFYKLTIYKGTVSPTDRSLRFTKHGGIRNGTPRQEEIHIDDPIE